MKFSEFDFTVELSDTVVVRGQPAMLDCSAQLDGKMADIRWLHDDIYINFYGENRR